jgi:hypothetical protein
MQGSVVDLDLELVEMLSSSSTCRASASLCSVRARIERTTAVSAWLAMARRLSFSFRISSL